MGNAYVPVYFDWIEVTSELSDEEKGRLIDAMVEYARGGNPERIIKGNEKYLFPAFRGQIERAQAKSSTLSANGAKGGRPRARASESKPEQKEDDEKPHPCAEEVEHYAREQGYTGFNAEVFVSYYSANGWMAGKTPVTDWRAKVREWALRDQARASPTKKNPALDYDQRRYTESDFGDGFFVDLEAYAREGGA